MTNEELFKRALNEGLSRRFDRELNSCSEEISPSKEHLAIMQAILKGEITEPSQRMEFKKRYENS